METNPCKKITIQIINDILVEERNAFDLYSTNELERIISFARYDKEAVIALIKNLSKEDIMQRIEDEEIKASSIMQSKSYLTPKAIPTQINKVSLKTKSMIISRNFHLSSPSIDQAWKFLSTRVTLIDLKDILATFDKMKLIKKVKKKTAGNPSSNINEFTLFIKHLNQLIEDKEKKYFSIYHNHYEANDIEVLKDYEKYEAVNQYYQSVHFQLPHQKTYVDSLHLLIKLPLYLQTVILSYFDIFTLGKIGLCCRYLYSLIYQRHKTLEEAAKIYNNVIWKNSGIYQLSMKKLSEDYKNSLDLFLNKPRVRFGGVYYSKVKCYKEGYAYGEEPKLITYYYYRVLRFFPDGSCFGFITPYHKTSKMLKEIQKGARNVSKGSYSIDSNNKLTIMMSESEDKYDLYTYVFINDKKGFEMESYSFYLNGLILPIDLRNKDRFKFRSIEILKDEFIIKSIALKG